MNVLLPCVNVRVAGAVAGNGAGAAGAGVRGVRGGGALR